MGRNSKFEPTKAQRDMVEALAAYGVPHEDICNFIKNPHNGDKPLNVKTLKKVFVDELRLGTWKMVSDVAQTLRNSAKGTPAQYDDKGKLIRAERAPDTTAAIFILKCRGGWRDRSEVHHSGAIKGTAARQPVYLLPSDAKL